jgi:hypothetical protein
LDNDVHSGVTTADSGPVSGDNISPSSDKYRLFSSPFALTRVGALLLYPGLAPISNCSPSDLVQGLFNHRWPIPGGVLCRTLIGDHDEQVVLSLVNSQKRKNDSGLFFFRTLWRGSIEKAGKSRAFSAAVEQSPAFFL